MPDEIKTAQKIVNIIIDFFANYSFQVIGAILILVIGFLVARSVTSFLVKLFERKNLDVTLSKFTAAAVKGIIIGFAIIIALGKFGITIAPFIAALAAMAFGASFAIQGPLANYGAGLVIILTRPFVVGNTITVSGVSGIVDEVNLGATILKDEDGVKITIPNKHIVGEILHNSEETKIHRLILRIPLLIRFYGNFACTQVLHLNLYKPMVYNTSTILVVNLGKKGSLRKLWESVMIAIRRKPSRSLKRP